MDLSKHKVLEDMYALTGMIEELGASVELTNCVIKLGEIMEDTEKIVDDSNAKDKLIPYC